MSTAAQKKLKYKYAPPKTKLKPTIIHVSKDEWVNNKRRMFQWAENQIAKHGYNGHTVNTLKELINCTDQKGKTHVTLETLHNRLISRHGKAAPSRRTLDNCIRHLVEGKSIKRSTQEVVKSLITTRLMLGKLVKDSTQELRTEYISTKRYIYREEVISKPTSIPSTRCSNIVSLYCKPASAPALWATALAGTNAQIEPEPTKIGFTSEQEKNEARARIKAFLLANKDKP